jgi:hypothetical protein
MKKLWIIVGIVIGIVLLLAGAWWYLLMNGRPEGFAIPNPFGDSGEGAATPAPTPDTTELPPVAAAALRKISTSPVAGAVAISRDGATYVRFVERGTGHVFEYDPNANGEGATTRISGTTIPRVTEAVWSRQGSRVALITETETSGTRTFVGAIERTDNGDGEGALTTMELPSGAKNIGFSTTGESVFYTVPTPEGSAGYEHNLKTDTRSVRFTSPLRDIIVAWGSEPDASLRIVVASAPSASAPGYAYEAAGGKRIAGGVKGLTVTETASHYVVSYAEHDSFTSRADGESGVSLGVPVFPEKCAADKTRTTLLWCGAPLSLPAAAYPDVWYDGSASFDDSLWELDVESGSATLVTSLGENAREPIDVTDLDVSERGDLVIFINKRDGALWAQELK